MTDDKFVAMLRKEQLASERSATAHADDLDAKCFWDAKAADWAALRERYTTLLARLRESQGLLARCEGYTYVLAGDIKTQIDANEAALANFGI